VTERRRQPCRGPGFSPVAGSNPRPSEIAPAAGSGSPKQSCSHRQHRVSGGRCIGRHADGSVDSSACSRVGTRCARSSAAGLPSAGSSPVPAWPSRRTPDATACTATPPTRTSQLWLSATRLGRALGAPAAPETTTTPHARRFQPNQRRDRHTAPVGGAELLGDGRLPGGGVTSDHDQHGPDHDHESSTWLARGYSASSRTQRL
jgi:hypothetical protein